MPDFLDGKGRIVADELRAFVRSHPADEAVKRPLYDAIDAYERVRRTGNLNEDVSAIVAAADDLTHPVGTFGRALLANLVRDLPAAQRRVLEMLSAPKAKVRMGIVFAVGSYAPAGDFKHDVLRKGLADRSKTVRQQAIRCADRTLVPELKRCREIETDAGLQYLIDDRMPSLTGEYFIHPDPGQIKSYSYYRRVENPSEYFVINCILEHRWLQLSIVLHDNPRAALPVEKYSVAEPVTRGAKGTLDPERAMHAIIDGFAAENAARGKGYRLREIRFAQSDFDCYDLYGEMARLIVRRLIAGGPWKELIIHDPFKAARS